MTVAGECHGGLYMVLSASIWEGQPRGRKAEGRRGDKARYKAGRKRFVSQKVLRVVCSELASQTAREDVKGTVRERRQEKNWVIRQGSDVEDSS